jgi:hypothetical protein
MHAPTTRYLRFKIGNFSNRLCDCTGLSTSVEVKEDVYVIGFPPKFWSEHPDGHHKFINTALVKEGRSTLEQREKCMFMEENSDIALTDLRTEKGSYALAVLKICQIT